MPHSVREKLFDSFILLAQWAFKIAIGNSEKTKVHIQMLYLGKKCSEKRGISLPPWRI